MWSHKGVCNQPHLLESVQEPAFEGILEVVSSKGCEARKGAPGRGEACAEPNTSGQHPQ